MCGGALERQIPNTESAHHFPETRRFHRAQPKVPSVFRSSAQENAWLIWKFRQRIVVKLSHLDWFFADTTEFQWNC